MSSNAILAAAVVAVAGSIGGTAMAASSTPAPHVTKVAVRPAHEIGKGLVAIEFRTDGTIARKANGKSIDASVGFHSATEHSVGSGRQKRGVHCYQSFAHSSAKVGDTRTVHILVQGTETVRKVHVTRDDGGTSIGC